MKFTDYYRLMGLPATATADEVKTAYRRLARKYHPDVSKEPGTLKRFTDLGEAYEVLQDPARRTAYDALRANGWKDGQEMDRPPPRPDGPRSDGRADGGTADFSDFFNTMFGAAAAGGGRRGSARSVHRERGDDLQYRFPVTLEEAYAGGERQFTLQTADGEAGGARSITVRIPKGVLHGSSIRLRGQGRPGADRTQDGDLYLEIELAEHRLYRVDGADVTLDLPIAPWEAVLGAQIEVATLGGPVTASIPAGAQQGQRLRLKGRGLPHDPPGDQYLALRIVVPTSASAAVKAQWRELAKTSAFAPRASSGNGHG